jgi:cysteine desulfurase
MIYLDHAATSPMSRAVIEAMWPYLTDEFANASSQHEAGKRAQAALQAARQVVADALHCRPAEVVFTSGGTESDNLAIKGFALRNPKGRHIVTSAIEHEAVLETCDFLEHFHGFRITRVPVDHHGLVDMDALDAAIDTETTLCSIQFANSEIGTVQNISDIAALARGKGVAVHSDAVQAAGLLPIDIQSTAVDMMSISGHKFGGPKGTGVLIVRSGTFLEPLVHGGGQERGVRSGTSNVAGAIGLATALHMAVSSQGEVSDKLQQLRNQLIDGVQSAAPHALLTGHPTQRLPNHASFCFPGTSGESVLLDLETRGIACSSGSACAADKQEASPVLLALGIEPQVAETAVRFALGAATTAADIDTTLAVIDDLF